MHEIIPAVLEKDTEALYKKVKSLPAEVSFFHMDVLEDDVWHEGIARQFEVHLMVEHPEAVIDRWVERGARRIIVHKISSEILKYRNRAEIGLAFELDDPIDDVLILGELADFIHVMSISEIGAQGHPLDERIFDRIKRVQEKFPGRVISVDGGITEENYQKLIEFGADRLIVGSHFNKLWQILQKTK